MPFPGRLRSRALVPLLAAALASPAFAQSAPTMRCGSADIEEYNNLLGHQIGSFVWPDEGEALQACNDARTAYPGYHIVRNGGFVYDGGGQGYCERTPQANRFRWQTGTMGGASGKNPFNNCATGGSSASAQFVIDRWPFTASCATRPVNFFDNPGDQSGTVCYRGCRYTILLGEGYVNQYLPDGATCSGDTGNPEPPEPEPDPEEPDPEEPDPEEPDPEEPDPEEPDPEEPDPEEPDPEEPDPEEPDPNEPNQPGQNVDMSGVESRLDALKQSVDVIPPKLDAIAAAIGRAGRCVGRGPGDGVVDECDNMSQSVPEGNTVSGGGDCESEPVCTGDPAQCAMVLFAWRNQCETKRLADALTSNGEGDGEGDPGTAEPGPDLSEYAQDPDTSGLVESIWQDAQDGEIELDTAGFGGSRSCPLLSLNIPAWMGSPNFAPVCNVMGFLANLFFAIAAVWGLAVVWRK